MESFVSKLKQDVQCWLCNDTLTEPKILKCYHSFCKPCIKRHTELIEEVNVFKCPKCKSETPLPELNSVDDLKPSVLHSRMVKVLEFVESEKVCSVSGSHPPASWHCFDCYRSLCDECQKGHSMFTKDHKVISLSKEVKEEDIKLLLTRENNCAVHADKVVELFCKDCEKMVCLECWQDNHDEHSAVSLAKYSAKYRACLSDQLEELKALELEMEKQVKRVEEETSKLVVNCEKTKVLVKESLQKMLGTLQKNAQELLNQIDENIDKAEKRKAKGQSVLDQTRGAIEYTKTLMEKGVASEVMENKDIKETCYTSVDRVVGAQVDDVLFVPNKQLRKQVKSGLGVLEKVERTDPNMSCVEVCSLLEEEVIRKLVVTTCTESGKKSSNVNDDIDVKIYPLDKVKILQKIVRTDGKIEVEFMPKVAGQLTAEVQVNGQHISNSPLVMNILSHSDALRQLFKSASSSE